MTAGPERLERPNQKLVDGSSWLCVSERYASSGTAHAPSAASLSCERAQRIPGVFLHGGATPSAVDAFGSVECVKWGNCTFFRYYTSRATQAYRQRPLPEPWLERRLRTHRRLFIPQIAFVFFRVPLTELRFATGDGFRSQEGPRPVRSVGWNAPAYVQQSLPGAFVLGCVRYSSISALVPV